MSTPSPENERAAFEGLLTAVDSIASFFNFTKELEVVVPELLTTMASAPPTDVGGAVIPEVRSKTLLSFFIVDCRHLDIN